MKRTTFLQAFLVPLLGWGWAGSASAAELPTLRFFGQAATLITSPTGTRIMSDPYQDGSQAGFLEDLPKGLEAEAVTISHPHVDHNNRGAVGGKAELINKAGAYQIGDILVRVYDGREGSPHGPGMGNRICVFDVGGARFVHLGDSGLVTNPEIRQAIGRADVVLVNIDDYVIPIPKIMAFMEEIQARTVIPAHWEGPGQLEAFLKTVPLPYVVNRGEGTIPLTPGMPLQVLVMRPENMP